MNLINAFFKFILDNRAVGHRLQQHAFNHTNVDGKRIQTCRQYLSPLRICILCLKPNPRGKALDPQASYRQVPSYGAWMGRQGDEFIVGTKDYFLKLLRNIQKMGALFVRVPRVKSVRNRLNLVPCGSDSRLYNSGINTGLETLLTFTVPRFGSRQMDCPNQRRNRADGSNPFWSFPLKRQRDQNMKRRT